MAKATISKGVKTKTTWANALKRDWQLYLLLMIPVALVVIFNYASYGGIRMVFIQFSAENLVRHSRAGMNAA